MYHFTSLIKLPDGPLKDTVWDEIFGICCEAFGLCASVGCGCEDGEADVICSEGSHGLGGPFRVASCEGPSWFIVTLQMPGSITLDLYFDETDAKPTFDGQQALRKAMAKIGVPITWDETTNYREGAW